MELPGFLAYKWDKYSDSEYALPSAARYRSGSGSVAYFQSMWAASWVREFGIDGIALDDAMELSADMLLMIGQNCSQALGDWRKYEQEAGGDPAARWTGRFMLVGVPSAPGRSEIGGDELQEKLSRLDAVIVPPASLPGDPRKCLADDQDGGASDEGNGGRRLVRIVSASMPGVRLCGADPGDLAVRLLLRRGPVLAVYGDETGRKGVSRGYFGLSSKAALDSDMNFPRDVERARQWAADRFSYSYTLASGRSLSQWQRVGQFRLRNPAVGAGRVERHADGGECRIYESDGYRNAVVIYFGGRGEIGVGGCFEDGETLRDAMTGRNMTATGGRVEITGGGTVHLIERYRRPYPLRTILDRR